MWKLAAKRIARLFEYTIVITSRGSISIFADDYEIGYVSIDSDKSVLHRKTLSGEGLAFPEGLLERLFNACGTVPARSAPTVQAIAAPSNQAHISDAQPKKAGAEELPIWERIPDKGNDRNIVRLCSEGKSDKEIANKIGKAEKTISNRLSALRGEYDFIPTRSK